MVKNKKKILEGQRIVFFGTPQFSVFSLDALAEAGIVPDLIVTAPDKPAGRGLVLQSSPVTAWGEAHEIPVLKPSSLKQGQPELTPETQETLDVLTNSEWDLFIVAAYGKLIPASLIHTPRRGTLNIHPSLLPKFRGASPIESQILADEKQVGVSIMQIDEEMDHGPVLAQASITPEEWPLRASMLEEMLATIGGELLAETIPDWLEGTLNAEPQAHDEATFTRKIEKTDGEISLTDDGYQNYLKYCAYDGWPGVFFFEERGGKKVRIKITDATYQDGMFTPLKIIPEGKKEMHYTDYNRSL